MQLAPCCLLTNDVETTSIIQNKFCDSFGERVLKEGMPILLDIYKKFGIKSTFFFTGHIARQFPDIVRMVIPDGHEVACHGNSHEDRFSFDLLSYQEQIHELSKARETLENISGKQVISFRAPALRVNRFTSKALLDSGFLIDSSIASQRFDMFLSLGSIKKLNRLFLPRLPYFTDPENLFIRGSSPLLEIPISSLLLPYIGTTMRIFPNLILFLRWLLHLETTLFKKPINFLIHPNEMIYEIAKGKVNRRGKSFFSYLFADLLRNKMKRKNLGHWAAELYKREISFFIKKNYIFMTLHEYRKSAISLKGE
ncbi:MAG TPA: polysaccharide deacetylase family protein [bacterium]|nr:polysaccharide deacetylase family protein [bacterium]